MEIVAPELRANSLRWRVEKLRKSPWVLKFL